MAEFTYEIIHDDYPINPRRDFDHAARMACWHDRYDLGDDLKAQPCPDRPEDFIEWADENRVLYLPLYLYDHSGITMSTGRSYPFNDPWDSGQVGYIYLTRETILKEWGWKAVTKKRLEKLYKYMEAEVKEYDQYLTGDVWGYVIKEDGEEVESCWGFYGYDYCEQEAKSIIENLEATTPKQLELELRV